MFKKLNLYLLPSRLDTFHLPAALEGSLRSSGHDVYTHCEPSWSHVWSLMAGVNADGLSQYYRFSNYLKPDMATTFRREEKSLFEADACVVMMPNTESGAFVAGYFHHAAKPVILFGEGDVFLSEPGHSMDTCPCSACGDLDGCHVPARKAKNAGHLWLYGIASYVCFGLSDLFDAVGAKGDEEVEAPTGT